MTKAVDTFRPGYYYRHINRQLIFKTSKTVERNGGEQRYFDSPFVEDFWYVRSQEELDKLKESDDSD